MKQIFPYILLLCIFGLISCKKSLPPGEYIKYVENSDNGLLNKVTVNGVKYSLQFQPVDYVVMLELRSLVIPPEKFKEQYARFKGIDHYVFHIDTKDMESLISKAKDSLKIKGGLINYFNFEIQKDIKLVEHGDTISCGIVQCESGMNMFPYYSFVLGFPANDYDGDREFLFRNKKLGTGDVKLLIKGRSMRNIPKLKMNG